VPRVPVGPRSGRSGAAVADINLTLSDRSEGGKSGAGFSWLARVLNSGSPPAGFSATLSENVAVIGPIWAVRPGPKRAQVWGVRSEG